MSTALARDCVIGGKYRLHDRIGKGGMGEVWSAEQIVTRKPVAMKFLAIDADEAARRRFMREARAACAVRHPNVVEIYDVIEDDDGMPVIVMELMAGESLGDRLRREKKLSVEDTALIFSRVSSALMCAHELGVVHRDLKPDNVFLASTPDGDEVKVIDFGIAKVGLKDEPDGATGALTGTGTILGTPHYMSPEQAFGEKQIDHRADVWSLGIMVYVCVTGVLPTAAQNIGQILKIIMTRSIRPLSTVAPELPPILTDLVDRMLSYAPAERPHDLAQVKAVFDAIVAGKDMVISTKGLGATPLGVASEAKSIQEPTEVVLRRASSRAKLIAIAVLVLGSAFLLLRLSRPVNRIGVALKRGVLEGLVVPSLNPIASSSAPLSPLLSAAPIVSLSANARPAATLVARPVMSAAPAVTSAEPTPKTANPLGGIVEQPPF
jgi:eukaryotic-like serine/threonine-protein kinase